LAMAQSWPCEDKRQRRRYVVEHGDYACTICGGDIDYLSSLSAEDCLKYFLSKPIPVSGILNDIKSLIAFAPVTRLDLSDSDWMRWSQSELDKFSRYLIENFPNTSFAEIDISNRVNAAFDVSDKKMKGIIDLFSHYEVKRASFNGLMLTEQLDLFVSWFNRSRLEYLDLSRTGLDANDLRNLRHLPAEMQTLIIKTA